jgi:hypothetical protein
MFEKENAYFKANLDALLARYPGKEIAIKGERILGVYDDMTTAWQETVKTEEPETFCVKKVEPQKPPLWCPFTLWQREEEA